MAKAALDGTTFVHSKALFQVKRYGLMITISRQRALCQTAECLDILLMKHVFQILTTLYDCAYAGQPLLLTQ